MPKISILWTIFFIQEYDRGPTQLQDQLHLKRRGRRFPFSTICWSLCIHRLKMQTHQCGYSRTNRDSKLLEVGRSMTIKAGTHLTSERRLSTRQSSSSTGLQQNHTSCSVVPTAFWQKTWRFFRSNIWVSCICVDTAWSTLQARAKFQNRHPRELWFLDQGLSSVDPRGSQTHHNPNCAIQQRLHPI